jgi:hypothetical protein
VALKIMVDFLSDNYAYFNLKKRWEYNKHNVVIDYIRYPQYILSGYDYCKYLLAKRKTKAVYIKL